MTVYLGGGIATMVAGGSPYGAIADGALVARDGRIAWVGPRAELPDMYRHEAGHDLKGGWLTPGLIDCHTHLVFAGERSGEFEGGCWAAATRRRQGQAAASCPPSRRRARRAKPSCSRVVQPALRACAPMA